MDTPGFDDTQRSDMEILEEIATYFGKLYDKRIYFSGLFYLHRITDPRMSGTTIKNLELFKLIWGKDAYPIVRLITTRWDEAAPGSAEYDGCIDRVQQLSNNPKYFQPFLMKGGQLLRHDYNNDVSGRAILDSIAGHHRLKLNIQVEMLDQSKTLGQTSAGLYLDREFAMLTQRYASELEEIMESLQDAIRERDEEALALLKAEQEQCEARRARLASDQQNMTRDFHELDARKMEDLSKFVERIETSENSDRESNGHVGTNRHGHKDLKSETHSLVAKESRRQRFKEHMTPHWHKTIPKERSRTRTSFLDVQLWLWGIFKS